MGISAGAIPSRIGTYIEHPPGRLEQHALRLQDAVHGWNVADVDLFQKYGGYAIGGDDRVYGFDSLADAAHGAAAVSGRHGGQVYAAFQSEGGAWLLGLPKVEAGRSRHSLNLDSNPFGTHQAVIVDGEPALKRLISSTGMRESAAVDADGRSTWILREGERFPA